MTSAHLYRYHLDAAEGDVTYGVIAIAGGQLNAGNVFSGIFHAMGKVSGAGNQVVDFNLVEDAMLYF